jgi:hypothetical protein
VKEDKPKPVQSKSGHRNPAQNRYKDGKRWERKRRQARNMKHQLAIIARRYRDDCPTSDQRRKAARFKIFGPARPLIVTPITQEA